MNNYAYVQKIIMHMFQRFARLVDLQRLKNVKADPMSVKVGYPCPILLASLTKYGMWLWTEQIDETFTQKYESNPNVLKYKSVFLKIRAFLTHLLGGNCDSGPAPSLSDKAISIIPVKSRRQNH